MIADPSITPFERDIADQGAVLRRVIEHYGGAGADTLGTIRALAADAGVVLLAGMGSSLSAARAAATRIGAHRAASAVEAGELLHYGLGSVPTGALVVLVSQSGRSAETVAVGERLQARGGLGIAAVTNDPDSPLAALADVTLPILAGEEATVATKTFATTFAVLDAIAAAIVTTAGSPVPIIGEEVADAVDRIAADVGVASRAAATMATCTSVSLVGRGPAVAVADYGALILKETVALPAEAMPGGSFRHGPLEVCGPDVGLVALAQAGPARALVVRLAQEASELGSPTWLIGDDAGDLPADNGSLRVTTLPAVEEGYVPLTMSVPIQRLAADLARRRGRVPGVLLRSQKVTDIE
jgi:glucosamine--fructose-6-phosphate aminotransferase (isomerizing)